MSNIKISDNSLKQIEQLYQQAGVQVRYGKGNFQAGYCLLEHKKIVLINKFYDTEAKIHALCDIAEQLNWNNDTLPPEQHKLLHQILSEQAAKRNKNNNQEIETSTSSDNNNNNI